MAIIKLKSMKILMLGASGWVATHLLLHLQKHHDFKILGTSRANRPWVPIAHCHLGIEDIEGHLKLVHEFQPDLVVNLYKCRDYESQKQIHARLIDYLNKHSAYYLYLSSANALDKNVTHPHLEVEQPNGASEYGQFKAECERMLMNHSKSFSIVRFSATHGWAPHRISRTVEFLEKLKNEQPVVVSRQIFQNRTYVGHLAEMLSNLILQRPDGIFHLGTTDQSEELTFLRCLADSFGHSEELVRSGEEMPFNLTVFPDRYSKLFGKSYTEMDTLKALAECRHLQYLRA